MIKYEIMSVYEAAGPFLSIALDRRLPYLPTAEQKILIHKPNGSTIEAEPVRFDVDSNGQQIRKETNTVFVHGVSPSDIPDGSELTIMEAK